MCQQMFVQICQKPRPELSGAVVERVVKRDECHTPVIQMLPSEPLHRLPVTQHLPVVTVDGVDLSGALPFDPLFDDIQCGILYVEQI